MYRRKFIKFNQQLLLRMNMYNGYLCQKIKRGKLFNLLCALTLSISQIIIQLLNFTTIYKQVLKTKKTLYTYYVLYKIARPTSPLKGA